MGKPKGRNGFFHYMIHKQQELKRNGQDLSINSPVLQQLAGDEWKGMSVFTLGIFKIFILIWLTQVLIGLKSDFLFCCKAMNEEERRPFNNKAKKEKDRPKNTFSVAGNSYTQRQGE